MKVRITKEHQSKDYLEALNRNHKFPKDKAESWQPPGNSQGLKEIWSKGKQML